MEDENRTRQLPAVRLNGTGYYIDISGRQFRETMNPAKRVDFDSALGENLCLRVGIVTCRGCWLSVLVGAREAGDGLRCMRCGRPV